MVSERNSRITFVVSSCRTDALASMHARRLMHTTATSISASTVAAPTIRSRMISQNISQIRGDFDQTSVL